MSMRDCPICGKVRITERMKSCASCANSNYLGKVATGAIVELRIDMSKVKRSTLEKIKEMIAEDERDIKGEK